jgi:hypothetical protein
MRHCNRAFSESSRHQPAGQPIGVRTARSGKRYPRLITDVFVPVKLPLVCESYSARWAHEIVILFAVRTMAADRASFFQLGTSCMACVLWSTNDAENSSRWRRDANLAFMSRFRQDGNQRSAVSNRRMM